jgi:S-adenosylmethionine:tRNA ribosyltransferase-isomerase
MKTSDFNYQLPEELIAQTPLERRDGSRLMTLDRNTGAWEHHHFYELPDFLNPGDCLILNDSRVLPARLLGQRLPGGGACEVLLLIDRGEKTWECLVRPGRHMREGAKLSFGNGELTAEVTKVLPDGNRLVRFDYEGIFLEILEHLGKMPLPPYIKEDLQDQERYQTVYSKVLGSAAAPTAGLHFTPELLEQIKAKGVNIGYVTLHVGLGTFRPVKEDEITDHEMHSEYCVISQETADLINRTKANGGLHLRGHHLLPDAGILGGGGRPHGGQGRLDQHLYLPRLPLQGDGRPCDQLPPAGEHPHHAGVRLCRTGACSGRL